MADDPGEFARRLHERHHAENNALRERRARDVERVRQNPDAVFNPWDALDSFKKRYGR